MINDNSIEIPDYIFKAELYFLGETRFADIAVFQSNRKTPIYCAWLNEEKIWVEKSNEIWVLLSSGIETILSKEIGRAIEKEKII